MLLNRTVLIATPDTFFGRGVRTFVETGKGFRVVELTTSANATLRGIIRLEPSIALIDLSFFDPDEMTLRMHLFQANAGTTRLVFFAESDVIGALPPSGTWHIVDKAFKPDDFLDVLGAAATRSFSRPTGPLVPAVRWNETGTDWIPAAHALRPFLR